MIVCLCRGGYDYVCRDPIGRKAIPCDARTDDSLGEIGRRCRFQTGIKGCFACAKRRCRPTWLACACECNCRDYGRRAGSREENHRIQNEAKETVPPYTRPSPELHSASNR